MDYGKKEQKIHVFQLKAFKGLKLNVDEAILCTIEYLQSE